MILILKHSSVFPETFSVLTSALQVNYRIARNHGLAGDVRFAPSGDGTTFTQGMPIPFNFIVRFRTLVGRVSGGGGDVSHQKPHPLNPQHPSKALSTEISQVPIKSRIH